MATRWLAALASSYVVAALDNGRAVRTPMGWRSYNQFNNKLPQAELEAQMRGMVSRNRTVDGVPTSLRDLGFSDFGLDDAWQRCGSYGPMNYTFHDANGRPVIDYNMFPDLLAMTNYAHSLNLTAGWYGNNCSELSALKLPVSVVLWDCQLLIFPLG